MAGYRPSSTSLTKGHPLHLQGKDRTRRSNTGHSHCVSQTQLKLTSPSLDDAGVKPAETSGENAGSRGQREEGQGGAPVQKGRWISAALEQEKQLDGSNEWRTWEHNPCWKTGPRCPCPQRPGRWQAEARPSLRRNSLYGITSPGVFVCIMEWRALL